MQTNIVCLIGHTVRGRLTLSSPCGWPGWTCTLPDCPSGSRCPCACSVRGGRLESQQRAWRETQRDFCDERPFSIFIKKQNNNNNNSPVKEIPVVGHKDVRFCFLNVVKPPLQESCLQPQSHRHTLWDVLIKQPMLAVTSCYNSLVPHHPRWTQWKGLRTLAWEWTQSLQCSQRRSLGWWLETPFGNRRNKFISVRTIHSSPKGTERTCPSIM